MNSKERYRPGSLRYTSEDGEVTIAGPHDLMFSTLSMLAQEYWCSDSKCWKPISLENDSEQTCER